MLASSWKSSSLDSPDHFRSYLESKLLSCYFSVKVRLPSWPHIVAAATQQPINLLRIASWIDEKPLAKTRCSTPRLFSSRQREFATSVNITVTRGNLSELEQSR